MSFILDREAIDAISNNIEEVLGVIKEISDMSPEMIMSHKEILAAFKYCFIAIIQAILTFSNYIIVKKNLGIPKDYRESLTTLIDAGILSSDFEGIVGELVAIRESLLYRGVSITITDIKNISEKTNTIISIYREILGTVKNICGGK